MISEVIRFCAQSQLGTMEAEVQSLITAREKKIEEIQMSLVDIQVRVSAQKEVPSVLLLHVTTIFYLLKSHTFYCCPYVVTFTVG